MSKLDTLLQNDTVEPAVRELVEQESNTPVRISVDKSLRIKATDNCGMTCSFCHNEGTPVSLAYQRDVNGRVSIYERTNGVNFTAYPIRPNNTYINTLKVMRQELSSEEIHWTGGEPTLNPQIVELTKIARDMGYSVKMTSNGETGAMCMQDLASAGLESVNFSIFGTTPEEISAVQALRFRNPMYGSLKLQKLHEAIDSAISSGIKVKANIVVRNDYDIPRVTSIIRAYGSNISIRLLNSLDDGIESYIAVYKCLLMNSAMPVSRVLTAGSSGARANYMTPEGLQIGFKQIYRVVLPDTCSDCSMNNDYACTEGYYGIRLYEDSEGNHRVGVCIQRMDLTLKIDEFLKSSIPSEILLFRNTEYNRLLQAYGRFIQE